MGREEDHEVSQYFRRYWKLMKIGVSFLYEYGTRESIHAPVYGLTPIHQDIAGSELNTLKKKKLGGKVSCERVGEKLKGGKWRGNR